MTIRVGVRLAYACLKLCLCKMYMDSEQTIPGRYQSMSFSVLMSVYEKEKPKYLKRALESLQDQSLPADEIVIVKDGKLTDELESVLAEFENILPIKAVTLGENVKLGRALAAGLNHCSFELVARMDSDDIAVRNRFEMQYDFMKKNPNIAVLGGFISEFIHEGEVARTKTMPQLHSDLKKYAKLRNPLNHMTVMFRKTEVQKAGGYEHFPLLEDYHLWSRMLVCGYEFANLDTVLVFARIGKDFSDKRGGFSYFKQYAALRRLQYRWGLTNGLEYGLALAASAVMTLQPKFLRDWMYVLLRKKSRS